LVRAGLAALVAAQTAQMVLHQHLIALPLLVAAVVEGL
jgi:hypothetical protein